MKIDEEPMSKPKGVWFSNLFETQRNAKVFAKVRIYEASAGVKSKTGQSSTVTPERLGFLA